MAEFAIRSLVTMIKENPSIRMHSQVPRLGSRLEIHMKSCIALLSCFVVVHLILWVTVWRLTCSVVVTDDSFVAIARLFRGVTNGFEERGTILNGKGICKAVTEGRRRLRDNHGEELDEQGDEELAHNNALTNDSIIYGPVKMGQDRYVMKVGDDVQRRQLWRGKRHPNGTYL